MAATSRAVLRPDVQGGENTRGRLLEVALRLFAQNSSAGTSLQMIADELGITKAAVYHHFRSRDELIAALIRPALDDMRALVDAASVQRTPQARAEYMVIGFVDLAIRHRKLTVLLSSDQAIMQLLKSHAQFENLVERPIALLGGAQPAPAGRINATLALAGIANTAGGDLLTDLDDETVRTQLIETGRRILGLRRPRTPQSQG